MDPRNVPALQDPRRHLMVPRNGLSVLCGPRRDSGIVLSILTRVTCFPGLAALLSPAGLIHTPLFVHGDRTHRAFERMKQKSLFLRDQPPSKHVLQQQAIEPEEREAVAGLSFSRIQIEKEDHLGRTATQGKPSSDFASI
ncbi:hypothetical protein E2C01_032123 [Portunus trituberculatus]|uniref:Uncharacterized protein n=1 Tax=Portunus trituberculatus TaxID=210409 RepID=A0A5B7EWP1_PORTR|nr:hypothetical protein [Portunus trituberculatus]